MKIEEFPSMRTIDVAVVGGGPAGAIAAARLAAAGADVVVFDHTHPREKACGGGISAAARRAFGEIDALASVGKSGTHLRVESPGGRVASVTGEGATFAIDRAVLDAALLDGAVKAGARHIAERVADCSRDANGWELVTPAGRVRARVVIGADGAMSRVRKRVAPKPDERHVALAAHGLVDRLDAPGALVKFFGDRRGYAWVFNRRDRSSVGVGVPMMRRDDWRRLWSTFFAEQAPGREAPPVVSWPLPLATDESAFAAPMAGDDWCLVGDAAGHVDPLTGEGIYYAMWGGQIAAACVARGKPAEYDTQWREAFLSTFLRHAATARHLEHRWRVELLVAGASLPFLNRKIYASMTSG